MLKKEKKTYHQLKICVSSPSLVVVSAAAASAVMTVGSYVVTTAPVVVSMYQCGGGSQCHLYLLSLKTL
jgi:hypothetical protein